MIFVVSVGLFVILGEVVVVIVCVLCERDFFYGGREEMDSSEARNLKIWVIVVRIRIASILNSVCFVSSRS